MNIWFVGAHPDDIELGCYCLVRRSLAAGYSPRFLILSDEGNVTKLRREEALDSVSRFGLLPGHVFFAGLEDGHVQCDKNSVSHCRRFVGDYQPDIVVAHSDLDGHQDHRAANYLVRSIFRRCTLLTYSVYKSGEMHFRPDLLLNMTEKECVDKSSHLKLFESQDGRIDLSQLESWEMRLAGKLQDDRAEGYVILEKAGNNSKWLTSFIEACDLARKN